MFKKENIKFVALAFVYTSLLVLVYFNFVVKKRPLMRPKLYAQDEVLIVNIQEEVDGLVDTYVRSDRAKKNFGVFKNLIIQADNEMVAMVGWDYKIAEVNWSEYEVDSASINMYMESTNGTKPFVIEAYPLLKPWREVETNWNLYAKNKSWNRPGARGIGYDYENLKLSSTNIDTAGKWYKIDISQLVSDSLYDNKALYGVLLRGDNSSNTEYRFVSSEGTDVQRRLYVQIVLKRKDNLPETVEISIPSVTSISFIGS